MKKLLYTLLFVFFSQFAIAQEKVEESPYSTNPVKTITMGMGKYTGQVNQKDQPDGMGSELDFNNKTVYKGWWQNGKRNGQGISYDYYGKIIYDGEWEDNKMDGYGKLYMHDRTYAGQFRDNLMDGDFIISYKDSTKYVGQWYSSNKKARFGTKYRSNGSMEYRGWWFDGLFSGEGELYYENGNVNYIGGFKKGRFGGQGTRYFHDGASLTGNWVNGMVKGKGILKTSYGATLVGQYDNYEIKKKATVYLSDGKKIKKANLREDPVYQFTSAYNPDSVYTFESFLGKYIGHLNRNGRFEGQGTMYYIYGPEYHGEFCDGKRKGKGRLIYHFDNNFFEGEFDDDKKSGFGKSIREDGTTHYEGEHRNGSREGKGIYYYKNGDRYEGRFVNDDRHGVGTYYFKDAGWYEGEWQNGQCNGRGILYDKDGGIIYDGLWESNKMLYRK